MKLAFTTMGTTLNSPLDPSFGRAPNFLVYDLLSGRIEVVSNQQNLNATQGAGIQAAQTIIKAGVQVLITGHCGPKAFRILEAAAVKVFNTDTPTIEDALARYNNGELIAAETANIEGHWV